MKKQKHKKYKTISMKLYNTKLPDIKIIKISGEMAGERVMTVFKVITRSPTISPLILIILISGDVYFILELGSVLYR